MYLNDRRMRVPARVLSPVIGHARVGYDRSDILTAFTERPNGIEGRIYVLKLRHLNYEAEIRCRLWHDAAKQTR